MKLQLAFLCLLAVANMRVREVFGAKILALLTLASPSHHIWNKDLMIALANRGHEVTVISADVDKEPVANLTYIHMKGMYEVLAAHLKYEDWTNDGVLAKLDMLRKWVYVTCEHLMSTEGAQLLRSYPDGKIFDLIIAESEYSQCFWGFISKFGNPPVIATCGSGIPRRINYMTGSPKSLAYVPDYMSPFSDKMSFMQRMEGLIIEMIDTWKWNFEFFPTLQEIVNRHFGQPMPALEEHERNMTLVLSNTVFGYDYPRPIAPNVIPVGGMHLKPARPLEQSLQNFLDGAENGAIFFCLGSNVQSAMMPTQVKQAFLQVFADLPYRVLWKFESDNLPFKPKNVMVGKWLPQRDILGHKNIKLFITHHGLFSSQEAVYFGVPTVGIPFFMDQHGNMERALVHGTGVGLSNKNLNKDTILTSINKVLNNASYAENARRLSAVFRDQIDNPLDRAVFWTEYVLRHGGAPHLRTAAVGMPLYRYLLLDVLGAVVAALVVALLATRWLWRNFRSTLVKNKTS